MCFPCCASLLCLAAFPWFSLLLALAFRCRFSLISIACSLLIIVVLVILLIIWQAGNEVSRKVISVKLKQINVASNGILVDVDALIRNMGKTAVELSGIYLHLVEMNQIHVIEVEEVFGADKFPEESLIIHIFRLPFSKMLSSFIPIPNILEGICR